MTVTESTVEPEVRRVVRARVPSGERREQYLEVAADLAVREGVAAVNMDAVAVGTGVNKALLYRQFSNRGEILSALFERETTALDEGILRAIGSAEGFEPQLRAWVGAWFDFIATRGTLLGRLMDARTVSEEVAPRHGRRVREIVELYGAWYAREFRLDVEVGRDAAAMLFAALGGVVDRWSASPTAATRRRLEAGYVDTVLGTLGRLASAD
ncbi:hypothetical protein BH18ACT1_BH18ACT1_12740 [soil metagenome]